MVGFDSIVRIPLSGLCCIGRGSCGGRCCVELDGAAAAPAVVRFCSDGSGEFVERGRDTPMRSGFDAEFVVTAPDVLHERVTADDHPGGVVAFESAHRSEPRFEAAVVGFDPIVRILLGVVKRGGA